MAEKAIRPDPNREPTHPGALLREDVLPPLSFHGDNIWDLGCSAKEEASRDPFDRIIAATARELGTTLITCDRALLDYGKQGHMAVGGVLSVHCHGRA
jgi:predicted nucleic acid-binding protein